jgi:hypothetical protein
VALCQARISTKPLWGFSSSNPYHSQSRAEQYILISLRASDDFLTTACILDMSSIVENVESML